MVSLLLITQFVWGRQTGSSSVLGVSSWNPKPWNPNLFTIMRLSLANIYNNEIVLAKYLLRWDYPCIYIKWWDCPCKIYYNDEIVLAKYLQRSDCPCKTIRYPTYLLALLLELTFSYFGILSFACPNIAFSSSVVFVAQMVVAYMTTWDWYRLKYISMIYDCQRSVSST